MFTPWTIDTYQTFNMERAEEQIVGYLQEENPEKDITYDDINWTYDMKGYVQALAEKWQQLLTDNILDDVILSVELDGESYSPHEYNFSTDNCATVFDVNIEKLRAYIKENQGHYNKNYIRSCDGFMCLMDDEQVMLHYYLTYKSGDEYKPYTYIMDVLDDDQIGDGYNFIDYELIKNHNQPPTSE